jgi:hypothetical protein
VLLRFLVNMVTSNDWLVKIVSGMFRVFTGAPMYSIVSCIHWYSPSYLSYIGLVYVII